MSRTASSKGQEGFTLAALIVILTIMSIIVAFTVPDQWSMILRRERDKQTIFLMKQYARAIMKFQAKHNNTVPVSLEQLQEARKPRLLRGTGKYPMPLTGREEDWILVPPQALQANAPGGGAPGAPAPPLPPGAQPVPQPGEAAFKLNKELSPPDYKGPFVAVRPNFAGKSFLALNEAEDYSEWVYTVDDLRREQQARQAALSMR
ncbi:MAG TPA: type II secretion system protein [Thermoanaerobaculia bacterium]|jgi:type II secretory pathway pseudopilin PulG